MSHTRLLALCRKGGLRRFPRGELVPLTLTSVQLELVQRIVGETNSGRRLVLAAMEMGTGKTLAALAALCLLRAQNSTGIPIRALFVVPKSTLFDAWRRQLRHFTRLGVNDLRVITYPHLQTVFLKSWRRSAAGRWEKRAQHPLLNAHRDLIVFDESHVLRNPHTILGRAASIISKKSSRVLCLSGTPVQNGPQDASGHLVAMGSRSGLEDPTSFGKRTSLKIEAVKAFTERFVYTATLLDAGISLMPKTRDIIWVEHKFSSEIATQYNQSLAAVQGSRCKSDTTARLKHHMLILRQLCVEPALFHKYGQETFNEEARRQTVANPGPKLLAALACIRNLVYAGHKKIVVVSEFVSLLDVFKDLARQTFGEEPLAFDGRLSAAVRGKVVNDFLTGNSRLMMLSLGAGAYGITLAPGPTAMVVLDIWFNPSVHDQIEARIHRPGQTKPVAIHLLVTKNSVESAILATHDAKRACATALVSGSVEEHNVIVHTEAKRIAESCMQVTCN